MAGKRGGCCLFGVLGLIVLLSAGGLAVFFVPGLLDGDFPGSLQEWVEDMGEAVLEVRVESLERDAEGRFAVTLSVGPDGGWTWDEVELREVCLRSDDVGYVATTRLDAPPGAPVSEPFNLRLLSDPMPDVADLWVELDLHILARKGFSTRDISWKYQQVLRRAPPRPAGEPGPDAPADAPRVAPDTGDDEG